MLLMVISSFILGLSYPLAERLLGDIDGLEFAFFFLLITTLIQLPFVVWRWREVRALSLKKHVGPMLSAGLVGTFLYWCEFSSLRSGLPVAHLTLITLTVPAWTLFFEYFSDRESSHHLAKWCLAMAGCGVLILSHGKFSFLYLMPVMTSFLMATWLVFSKRCQDSGVTPLINSFFNDVLSLVGIICVLYLKGKLSSISSPDNLGSMTIYAILIGLIPGLLFLHGLKEVDLVPAATLMVIEPLLTGVVSIVVSQESLSIPLAAGASMVAASNLPDQAFSEIRRMAVISTFSLFR